MRWTVITNCDSFFITKCDTVYYKLRQVLQSAMDLLQIATGITKRDDYYKLRQYKRVMLHVQPVDSIGRLSNPPRTTAIVYTSGFILWLDFR